VKSEIASAMTRSHLQIFLKGRCFNPAVQTANHVGFTVLLKN